MPRYFTEENVVVENKGSTARTAIEVVGTIIIVVLIIWVVFFSGWQNNFFKPVEKRVDVNITVPANR